MAQPKASRPPQQASNTPSKKRKEPPASHGGSNESNKKQKTDHRARQRDARALSTQTTGKAFANGALDVDAFVKAREFEMRALDSSMQRSKKALNRRAFQQVPKDLRRRTASHNVKRIPKRLRERGKKEMLEDNTPTVTARRRKLTGHMRLRLETVKKLRALGAQNKAAKQKPEAERVTVINPNRQKQTTAEQKTGNDSAGAAVKTRKSKVKKAALAKPPIPKAKFRKRQLHKSWLPTHLFHAKRAHMTPPAAPLWRFAIPLTPTQKSYRPTHRASHEKNAVAWDTSHMATVGLEGEQRSIEGLLKALGVGRRGVDANVWSAKRENWRRGQRVLETFAFEREAPHRLIAPISICWCGLPTGDEISTELGEKRKRKVFLRVHPSAFYELWEEVVRLAKVSKPAIRVEDLRFEIGSIEITGPGSTEALQGALWPTKSTGPGDSSPEKMWGGLTGVTDPSALPSGALLGFTVQDPRLHHPPRTIKLPKTQGEQDTLLELLSSWPCDQVEIAAEIFDRSKRLQGSKLASQKSINRRKSLAGPGEYPSRTATDPKIPILVYTSTSSSKSSKRRAGATWTILAPWRTIQPIWYSIMYYPLSTGQQPRFGGLREQQQLAFEDERPWFPADCAGTKAGWDWEVVERRRRWEEWKKKPKGKRVSWEKVDLGNGRKGEVGKGWSCDWECLLRDQTGTDSSDQKVVEKAEDGEKQTDTPEPSEPPPRPKMLSQVATSEASLLLQPDATGSPVADLDGKLLTVRIDLLNRGVPQTCARIYRLPSLQTEPDLRKAWLAIHGKERNEHGKNRKNSKHALPKLPKDAPPHLVQQRLAQSLLQPPRPGEDSYPGCPGPENLIGFVTTGNFNLAEGKGTGIGNLLLGKIIDETREKGDEGRLCIVRNPGADVARLARWEVAD